MSTEPFVVAKEVAKRLLAGIEKKVKMRGHNDIGVQVKRFSALFHSERFQEKCSLCRRERRGSWLQICREEEDAIGKRDPSQTRH
jgi:hypothetical protein